MTLAIYQGTALINSGGSLAVAPGAHVRVKQEIVGQPLAALKADRDGLSNKTNPFDADENGYFAFYAAGGFYQIEVYTDTDAAEPLRYVAIGLNAGSDAGATLTEREVTAAGDVTIAADDADIIYINKTVGEPTTVNLPSAAARTKAVTIVDWKGDAATNNITMVPVSGQKVYATTDYTPKIRGNGGRLTLTPKQDGSGWS